MSFFEKWQQELTIAIFSFAKNLPICRLYHFRPVLFMEMDCPASAVPASCNTGIQMDASHLRSCCAPQWNICLTQLVVLFLCNETQRWNKTHLQRQRVIKDRTLEQVLKCGCLLESYHLAFPTPTSWCAVLFPQLFKVVKCMELGSSEHSFRCRSHSNKFKKKKSSSSVHARDI